MKQLAETGWKQMHGLLLQQGMSTEMPSAIPSSKKRNWFMAIAASILLFIIFSSPFVLNDKHQVATTIPLSREYSSSAKTKVFAQPKENHSSQLASIVPVKQKEIARQKLKADYLQFRKEQAIATLQDQREFFIQKFSMEKIANTILPQSHGHIDTAIGIAPSVTMPKKSTGIVARKVQFYAGAGINISEGDQNSFSLRNFNIHPGFTVLVPLTHKLSLHTGFWAFSALHKKEASAKERQIANIANLYYNINTTSLVKASYFDLPITLHYAVAPNWSVGGGLQLSKLYKISIKEKKDSYDYNNLLLSSTVNQYNSTAGRAPAISQKRVEVKNFEPRFVVETSFNYHNWLLSAGYYYGADKTITLKDANSVSHHYRNEYFKCGIQYRIQWKK